MSISSDSAEPLSMYLKHSKLRPRQEDLETRTNAFCPEGQHLCSTRQRYSHDRNTSVDLTCGNVLTIMPQQYFVINPQLV